MKPFQLNLNLTGVIVTLSVGILLPVMLLTAVGIVALVIARDAGGIVTGVLVISFAVTAIGNAIVAVALIGRKNRLARRQADFVANISHEFRTPLSAIRLYTQTLQSGRLADDPEETARALATILRETEWLNLMVDRVLTWRASSRDMLELEMESGAVGDAVDLAMERFRGLVEPGRTVLTCTVDSRTPVRHDVNALSSVVLNLLTNAYKYTGEDKVIRVGVRDEEKQVLIEVQDNGIGLTAAEASRVFQPFYRAKNQRDGRSNGTGLGLAIASYLINRHKGTLSVRSDLGRGATFTIRLPAEPGRS